MSSQAPQIDPLYIRLLKFLGPFLLSAGGLAGGYSVAQKITQNPALQIIIAIVAGLIGYTLSFFNKVWQKLEGPLVDKTAAWVPSFVKNRFAGYRKQYLNYLSRAHRVLEFNGLLQRPAYNRELNRIFVEPTIALIPPHQASSHLLKRAQPLNISDSHDIWHFLNNDTLNSAIFVLIGAAGSGKTTLIKDITYALSQTHMSSRLLHRRRLQHSLPVLLYLRDHLSAIKNQPERTLPTLVQSSVQSKGHVTIPLQWYEQQFKRGKCLVMLDGLDEAVDEDMRKLITKWIQGQCLSYPKNRFILTTRPHGYLDTPLDDALVLNIQPFTPTQIKKFINQWFLIDELMRSEKGDPGIQLRASESTSNLLVRLDQKPSLLELAANPLLLTMIVTLASTGSSLPNDRLELYREIFQVLLYRRRDAIGLTPKLSVQQKLEVLQPLASHMMQNRLLELEYDRLRPILEPHITHVSSKLTTEEFLKDIEQNSGLMLEVNPGSWGFAHKTFQENLAATYLKEKRKESTLIKHIGDDWWHETICFYCAQVDATKIIQACLDQSNTSVEILNLALECSSQKLRADPSIDLKIEKLLQTGIEDTDSRKRTIIAEALLKRRLEAMGYLSEDVYIDTVPVNCAEYQLFLDDQSAQGRYYHPWHWHTDSFELGQGHEPILGIQPLDVQAFCSWLTARENERWHYRLPHKEEIPQAISHMNSTVLNIGFWAEDNKFIWLDGAIPEYKNLEELILDQLLLDRAKALAYNRVRARDKREPIDEILELERDLNEMHAPDVNPLLAHNIKTHPLAFNRSYFASDISSEAIKIATPIVVNHLNLLNKRSAAPYTEEEKHLRWFTRFQCQVHARRTYFAMQNMADALKRQRSQMQQRTQEKVLQEQEFAFYRRLCIDLALLELREKGRLTPWEAILLIKERQQFIPS